MAAADDILQSLPIDQLAQQVGAQPEEVEQAVHSVLPALLGGLQANAQDPGGASSIVDALGQHDPDLLSGGLDLGQVDQADGQKIASHIFGSNEEQVYSALGGGSGAGGQLVKRLIPILAPIVLSYLSNKVLKGGGGGLGGAAQPAPSQAPGGRMGQADAPGSLDDMLRDVLGGAVDGTGAGSPQQTPQQSPPQPQSGGSILDVLGGLLGGGRR